MLGVTYLASSEVAALGTASNAMPWPRSRVQVSSVAPPTDQQLVERARSGDAEAFGVLVRRHRARIERVALHMLRDRTEAEDVTQETFVRAYRALARFDGRSQPFTWLYRIAINLSLNTIRSRKTRQAAHAGTDPRLEALKPTGGLDPAEASAQRELYAALCEGIDSLSDTLRTTLIVVSIDGRSHEEAAQILGAPEGTIAWRVHEARRKLRAFLAERGLDITGEVA